MGWGKVKPIYLLICFYMYLSILIPTGTARVMLMGGNVTLSFGDIEAIFALPVERDGISGVLHLAEPLDACSPLTYKIDGVEDERLPFALIIRGGCTFDDKVRAVQEAGFKAAIVYDNEDNGGLVAMAGNSEGINICAVFVSKASGVLLKRYIDFANMELWIIPSFDSSSWSIIVICFISVVAMVAVLGTCFFIRRHQIRRARPRPSRVREFHGMSSRLVKALPSLIFDGVFEDNCTSQTCAICLEDYNIGEKLRVLPCHHKFHAACVDSWLTTWRTFCPVCKRDARTTSGHPLVSECTPLLSSSLASPSSSTGLSSMRSVLASSAAIQRALVSSQSPSVAQAHYFSTSPLISYRHIPGLSLSRSSIDLSNATSRRPHAFHLFSSHSLGYPSLSPFISRHFSFYFPSPSNASLSYVGSTGRRAYLRHHGESEASFYPFASTQSLPGC